jgi:phosphoglycerate dehydrogenase-like enzyme
MLLEGRTLGVIGLGRIGTKVARIARAFDMNVLAAGKTLTDQRAAETGARRVSLDALLEESDIVTVHCRLNAETRGLIGRPELQRMKPDALLINTARGPIISEEALVESLKQGYPGGVGLDVYDEEPLPPDHPLRGFGNVLLTSHRGYAVDRILHQRYQAAFSNVIRFIEGAPVDVINPDAV